MPGAAFAAPPQSPAVGLLSPSSELRLETVTVIGVREIKVRDDDFPFGHDGVLQFRTKSEFYAHSEHSLPIRARAVSVTPRSANTQISNIALSRRHI